MATRESLYGMFGPKLIEAVVQVIRDEVNLLRSQHSLSERTNQQLLDAVEAKYETLGTFPWEDNTGGG